MAKDQIMLIDEDQGQSGKHAAGREGFQRLVADVEHGKDRPDHGHRGLTTRALQCRLAPALELCRFRQRIIADADGVYNPRDFNDRLLLLD